MRYSPIFLALIISTPVVLAENADTADLPNDTKSISEVVNGCNSCHSSGVSGAPRSDDQNEWRKRLERQGIDRLVQNTIQGIGSMPPRGGQNISDAQAYEATKLLVASALSQPIPAVEKTLKQIVRGCGACHSTGVANAPRFDDRDEWAKRLQQNGFETLVRRSINGWQTMPPRGGQNISDAQVRTAMIEILARLRL